MAQNILQPTLEQTQSDPNNSNEQCKIAYPTQFVVPPMETTTAPTYQYNQPMNGFEVGGGLNPASMVVQLGHNPSQNGQTKRPWWIWTIGIADIVIALLFSARVGYTVVTKDVFIRDRDTLMWVFFLMFLSLAVQFLMGVGLILGLLSSDESTTIWYLQGWLCGAYFLIGETGILTLGSILKLKSGGADVGYKDVLILGKSIFRVISFILVRRFLNNLKKRSMYRVAEAEHQQHQILLQNLQYQRQEQAEQRQRQQQLLQLQQEEALQRQHLLQLQQLHEVQQTPTPPNSAHPNSGPLQHEYLHYAPQMSYMMTMMMNNTSSN